MIGATPRALASEPGEGGLRRALTLVDAVALVIGSVIGTGILLKPAVIAQTIGSPARAMLVWIVGGILALAGSLSYAELAGLLPRTGGDYVYNRQAYGKGVGFLFGWTHYVSGGGAIAAYSVAFVTFFSSLVPFGGPWWNAAFSVLGRRVVWQFGPRQGAAALLIVLITAINWMGIVVGARMQTAISAAKVFGLAAIIAGGFLLSPHGSWAHFQRASSGPFSVAGFGAALFAALWAYSGWYDVGFVAGEIRDPARNLPRALIVGMSLVTAIYLAINAAYFFGLPWNEVLSSNSTRYPLAPAVAAKVVDSFAIHGGATLVTLLFLLSIAGGLNSTLLAAARIPFAMSRDGLIPEAFERLGRRSRAPIVSLGVLGAWAALLAVSGTFDQLVNLTLFGYGIFFTSSVSALFVLRRKMPAAPRPYRVTGYPVTPALFILGMIWLLVSALAANPVESVAALGMIAAGGVLYLILAGLRSRELQRRSHANRQ